MAITSRGSEAEINARASYYAVRMLSRPRRCEVCGQALGEGRTGRVCSPKCRTARWRQARTQAHATTVAYLQTENTQLRHRVAELEHLVAQLKTRLWGRR
jgi:hypothetical protein